MLPAFVDLFADLDGLIEPEAEMLRRAVDHLEAVLAESGEADPLRLWLLVHAVASGTEKVYTGLEKIMERIAATVDGAPIPQSGSWHQDLLRRMGRPFPDVRPALLDEPLVGTLSALCSFRHRERNMYGAQIKADVLAKVARDATAVVPAFRAALAALQDHLAGPAA